MPRCWISSAIGSKIPKDAVVRRDSGTLRGKESLRMYWGKAFQLLPSLHFDLIDTYVSPDSVVVFYQNERGAQICEYLRLDARGKIRQGSANHLAH
jgi:hypothetical protein